MKTWKLVSGILSIIFSIFVLFQSCAVGLSNTLQENQELGGSAGLIVAIMLLSGGIVSIAARNTKKGGNIAIIVLYSIGVLVGYSYMDNYGDLLVWATWCLVCVILAIIAKIKQKKAGNSDDKEESKSKKV